MIPEYMHLFVGHSNDEAVRKRGSSGGVCTAVLKYLLSEGLVDAAIGVGYDSGEKTQPVYKMVEDPSGVDELSGSKYIFMDLPPVADLLKRAKDKRVAVVVQPCFVKFIKEKFSDATYIISFFCGYNIEYAGTEYLLKKAGVKAEDIQSIDYRGGESPGGFTVTKKDGSTVGFGKEYYELVDLLFLRESCRQCHFYISGDADIVVGDAWLKKNENESVVLTNTVRGDEVVKNMHNDQLITLYDLTREELSRMHRHNLKYKNSGHSLLMRWVVSLFNNRVARRIAPFKVMGFLSRLRRRFAVGIDKELKETVEYS